MRRIAIEEDAKRSSPRAADPLMRQKLSTFSRTLMPPSRKRIEPSRRWTQSSTASARRVDGSCASGGSEETMAFKTYTVTRDSDLTCPSCGHNLQLDCEVSVEVNLRGGAAGLPEDELLSRAVRVTERCPVETCGYHSQRK